MSKPTACGAHHRNGLGGTPGELGMWAGNDIEGGALPPTLQQDNSQKPIAILIAEQQASLRW